MNSIPPKAKFTELNSHFLTDKDFTGLLYNLTGCIYRFASSSDMRWGKDGLIKHMGDSNPDGFFQLMPDTMDDGFFDWYCYYREEYQFFVSKENASLQFIYYWLKWTAEGKPKAF